MECIEKMANDALLNAKKVKNDEFYTLYEYIQKEVNAYLEYNPDVFKNKTVFLLCFLSTKLTIFMDPPVL